MTNYRHLYLALRAVRDGAKNAEEVFNWVSIQDGTEIDVEKILGHLEDDGLIVLELPYRRLRMVGPDDL
jgi:hypothetical protein